LDNAKYKQWIKEALDEEMEDKELQMAEGVNMVAD